MRTSELLTPPNVVTLARIALIAAAAAAWLLGHPHVGIALGAVAGATDYLDGYLARRLGLSSSFGAMLDQFADGFLFLVALAVALDPPVALSPACLVVAMARELWVHGIRRDAAAHGLAIPSSRLGKLAAGLLGWGLIPLFAGAHGGLAILRDLGTATIILGLVVGLASALGYTATYLRASP